MEENSEREIINNALELHPYRYEPMLNQSNDYTGSESDSSVDDNEENYADVNTNRIGNTQWCSCGMCVAMNSGLESVCCKENPLITARMEDVEIDCITAHEGFIGNCINRYVIETSLYAYVQEVSPTDDNELPHRTYRYISYRNFTRFIYHRLRKYERKVIPSCCVHKIRTAFPDETYCGFKYAKP